MSADAINSLARTQADKRLKQQNDRLQLLLKLTNSITANLELKKVLREIAANIRQLMRCDATNISLPGPEPGSFRIFALDFPAMMSRIFISVRVAHDDDFV